MEFACIKPFFLCAKLAKAVPEMMMVPTIEIWIMVFTPKHLSTVCDTLDKFGKMDDGGNHAKSAENVHVPSEVYLTIEPYFGGIVECFAVKMKDNINFSFY